MTVKSSSSNTAAILFFLAIATTLLVASAYALFEGQIFVSITVAGLACIVSLIARQRIEPWKLEQTTFEKTVQIIAFLIICFGVISIFTMV